MRLRLRPPPPSPAPADRVRDLLATGVAGWVPTPEPPGGMTGGVPLVEDDADSLRGLLPRTTSGQADAGQADAGQAGAGQADADRTTVDQLVHPSEDARWLEEEPSGPGPGSSWQRWRGAPHLAPPDAAQERSSRPRARLDPGWRGAVALVVVALLAALVAAGVVLRGRPQAVAAPDVVGSGVALPGSPLPGTPAPGTPAPGTPAPGAFPQSSSTAGTAEVVVAVAGKVARPGLVRLPAGSRVDDAVRAAGGPLPGADVGLLNVARKLVDGEQVLVGVDPPPGVPVPPAAVPEAGGGPLDLNSATAADLDALPGIGPVLAQRIVDWRTENGRFTSVAQLREVTGIGESKYADLEGRVTV